MGLGFESQADHPQVAARCTASAATFFVLCGRNGATCLWRFPQWKRILNSVFCKIRGYNRKNLYLRIILIGIFCINVMVKLHQFSDNLYGTDFTELKNYLAACNAYEEPSQAKLQIIDRTIIWRGLEIYPKQRVRSHWQLRAFWALRDQQFHGSLRDLVSTGSSFPRPRE